MIRKAVWIALFVLLVLSVSGCCCCLSSLEEVSWRLPTRVNAGQMQRETHRADTEGADQVEVTVAFGGGSLDVSGGSEGLFEGEFAYNVTALEPVVEYGVKDGQGELMIRHGAEDLPWDPSTEVRNEWQIKFGDQVPLDMHFQVGASRGTLDLGGLRVIGLEVDAGAADMTVRFDSPNPEPLNSLTVRSGAARIDLLSLGNANLRELAFDGGLGTYTFDFGGEWQHSAEARIQAGASRVELRVPRDIGVRVCPGDLRRGDYGRLGKRGECYVNERYGQAEIQLTITLDLGLGQLQVHQVN